MMLARHFVRSLMFALLLAWVHGAFAVDAINTLPPALQAAIASGNPSMVKHAISTNAGNDLTRVAKLSLDTVNAAEKMVSTNPANAVIVALAALESVQPISVITADPVQTASVVRTAGRIFASPVTQRVAPTTVISLASLAIGVASDLSNVSLIASTAQQALVAAENLAVSHSARAC
jgi:hypothetical protein